MKTDEQLKTENALKHLGFQLRIKTAQHRKDFDNLKHTCPNRGKNPLLLPPYPNLFICKKIRWHTWLCEMGNCPLLEEMS